LLGGDDAADRPAAGLRRRMDSEQDVAANAQAIVAETEKARLISPPLLMQQGGLQYYRAAG
jgi:hypothetical protein